VRVGNESVYRGRFARVKFAAGLRLAPVWATGGLGLVLSKALLDGISEAEWRQCEDGMLGEGGDVRLASCIFTFAALGPTTLPGLGHNLSQHRPRRDPGAPRACRGGVSASTMYPWLK
jgi:hypothetical protein